MSPRPNLARRLGAHSVALLAMLAVLSAGWTCAESPLYADWHVWVDARRGIALDLPPTHDVGSTNGVWYVHGWIDGEAMVPDMSLQFLADVDLEEAIAQAFAPDALVEHVRLGRGTPARRVTARYETPDGVPYVSSGYAVPVADGVFVIRRWEGFDWRWFDHVALTFRVVETGRDMDEEGTAPAEAPEAPEPPESPESPQAPGSSGS